MSSKHICTTCLRGLRRQLPESRPLRHAPARSISSSLSRWEQKTAPTQAKPAAAQSKSAQDGSTVKKGLSPGIAQSVAQAIRYTAPNLAEPYVAYGATEILVRECARVADYTISEQQRMVSDEEGAVQIGEGHGWWYEQFGLQPCFNTWAQITFLHMWMLTVRFRTFPAENASVWHQQLIDHFFYLAEEKMTISHNIASRAIRNNYLKDLFTQWRGLTVGYDQGMIESDAFLAAAIWRNICGSKEDVNLVGLAHATSYVRSVLQGLEGMDVQDIAAGQVVFEDPSSEKEVVSLKSRLWTQAPETDEALSAESSTGNTATTRAEGPPRPAKFRKAPARPATVKGATATR